MINQPKFSRLWALALVFLIGLSNLALAQDKVVNVYSSRHYDIDNELYQQFSEITGIKVNLIEANDNELIERVLAEGSRSEGDMLLTSDAGRLWQAQDKGLLQSVSSEILEGIPDNLRDPEGYWFALTQRARVIIYNSEKVSADELSSYEDLTDAKWKGRICVRSSTNIYNQSLLASLIVHHGEEAAEAWAQGIVDNFARKPQGGDTDQILAVASGECDIALANSYYFGRLLSDPSQQEATKHLAIFFPNQEDRGTHVNISGAGILANAPHPEAALALLEYLLSPEVQGLFAEANNEFPVIADVPANAILASWGEFKKDDINVALYGENNQLAVQIFDRVGWP
ncbi:MAG: Fe(3+) ABC transporter substrate-binding protein [Deinococcales bacterium]